MVAACLGICPAPELPTPQNTNSADWVATDAPPPPVNLAPGTLAQPWRFAARLTGMHTPHGQIFFGMRLPLHRRKSRAAARMLLSWQPERIILSHGRCFEANGTDALKHVFGWLL